VNCTEIFYELNLEKGSPQNTANYHQLKINSLNSSSFLVEG